MGSIIFQVVLMLCLVGFLIFLARDDRRNRALRLLEDAEEQRQAQLESSAHQATIKSREGEAS